MQELIPTALVGEIGEGVAIGVTRELTTAATGWVVDRDSMRVVWLPDVVANAVLGAGLVDRSGEMRFVEHEWG